MDIVRLEIGVYQAKDTNYYVRFSSPCSFQIVSCSDITDEPATMIYLYPANSEKGHKLDDKLREPGEYKVCACFPSAKERKTLILEVKSTYNPFNLYQGLVGMCNKLGINLSANLSLPIKKEADSSVFEELKQQLHKKEDGLPLVLATIGEVSHQLKTISEKLDHLDHPSPTVDVSTISQQLKAVSEKLDHPSPIVDISSISQQLKEIMEKLDQPPSIPATPAAPLQADTDLDELKEQLIHNNVNIQTLTEQFKQLIARPTPNFSGIEKRLEQLESTFSSFQQLCAKMDIMHSLLKVRQDIPEDFRKLLMNMQREKDMLYTKLMEAENYIEELESYDQVDSFE
ncbi:MAG: hypothetical protein ACYCQJ_13390 [Nitrososphaerales archaeon]